MAHLRQAIYLRSYAGRNPLQDYVNEGYENFAEMQDTIAIEAVLNLLNAQIRIQRVDPDGNEIPNDDEEVKVVTN